MTQRVALVTGAMGGLGTAICQELAKAGHKVVASYHPQFDNKDEWLKEMAEAGFKDFVCVAGDVASLEDCQKMVADAEAACGQVDILVNNAGITRDATLRKLDKAGWDAVLRTNLDSMFNVTKPFIDPMVERGWGRIVNISSINGSKGQFGQTNYSAAKAGVHGFTKALAQELIVKDKVQYIAGLYFTPDAMAVAPLLEEAKTPMIVMNAATSAIVEKSPYIVRTSFTMWQNTVPAAKVAKEKVAPFIFRYRNTPQFSSVTKVGIALPGKVELPLAKVPDLVTVMRLIRTR